MIACLTVLLIVLTYVCLFLYLSVCIFLMIAKNTPLNLTVMSIECFVAICQPLQHPLICTVNRTYVLITCIWVLGAIPVFMSSLLPSSSSLSFFSTGRMCYHRNVWLGSQLEHQICRQYPLPVLCVDHNDLHLLQSDVFSQSCNLRSRFSQKGPDDYTTAWGAAANLYAVIHHSGHGQCLH